MIFKIFIQKNFLVKLVLIYFDLKLILNNIIEMNLILYGDLQDWLGLEVLWFVVFEYNW